MRKLIILGGLVIVIVLLFLLETSPGYYIDIVRGLNRDVVYFPDGSIVNIWLWDDKGGVVIGEGQEGEVLVFDKDEYKEISQNTLLRNLGTLI